MLPEKLSTDLTSLGENQERLAVVVEMAVAADGAITGSDIYRAVVRNRAKLAYDSLAAWLEGNGFRAAEGRRSARTRRTAPRSRIGSPRPSSACGMSAVRCAWKRSKRARSSRTANSPTCVPTRRIGHGSSSRTS